MSYHGTQEPATDTACGWLAAPSSTHFASDQASVSTGAEEQRTNTGCMTAEQNKVDSHSLLVNASNREGISPLNLAHLRRCCETIRQILLCR